LAAIGYKRRRDMAREKGQATFKIAQTFIPNLSRRFAHPQECWERVGMRELLRISEQISDAG
jgi:hypothetical protein